MHNKLNEILSEYELFGFCKYSSLGKPFQNSALKRLPVNPKTVITFLFPYKTEYEGERNLSQYCIGEDYHNIILNKLKTTCQKLKEAFPEHSFEPFSDISPINEVLAAYNSGLGFLGKNTLLINKKYGSYCFIGEIITTLEIDAPSVPLGSCLNCGLCEKICPTFALKAGVLDTSLCLSAITQKKGELTEFEEKKIREGGLVWGCDKCSDICPMNKDAKNTNILEFTQNLMPFLDEEGISSSKNRAYDYRGKAILRRNLSIINSKSGKLS